MIHELVQKYMSNTYSSTMEDEYGPIEEWNTSLIMNMQYLFKDYEEFNRNINN